MIANSHKNIGTTSEMKTKTFERETTRPQRHSNQERSCWLGYFLHAFFKLSTQRPMFCPLSLISFCLRRVFSVSLQYRIRVGPRAVSQLQNHFPQSWSLCYQVESCREKFQCSSVLRFVSYYDIHSEASAVFLDGEATVSPRFVMNHTWTFSVLPSCPQNSNKHVSLSLPRRPRHHPDASHYLNFSKHHIHLIICFLPKESFTINQTVNLPHAFPQSPSTTSVAYSTFPTISWKTKHIVMYFGMNRPDGSLFSWHMSMLGWLTS